LAPKTLHWPCAFFIGPPISAIAGASENVAAMVKASPVASDMWRIVVPSIFIVMGILFIALV
jgi:hypothetical protein